MFKNAVVGVDLAGGGRDAIALSRMLLEVGGQLTLAHISTADADSRSRSPTTPEPANERVAELLQSARDEAGVHASLRSQGAASVGRGLHELCEAIDADLLIVGSSRRGVIGRVLLGDDTAAALNGAPCAIAVAPAGYADRPRAIRAVGVAYNGSPESDGALAVGRTLAAEHKAKLSALEVVSLPTYAFVGGPVPIDNAIDDLLEDSRRRIAALDGVEPRAVYGIPFEELALYSASLDLLVVGSRGYGPIGRLVHGSTSRQLARNASCPVLVLPRATAPASA